MKWMSVLLLIAVAAPLRADPVPVPSGQGVELLELIKDPDGLTWRFRFVAPAIARDTGMIDQQTALEDIHALCETYVAPLLLDAPEDPDQIVISMADRATVFGEAAPDVTQYFEAYRVEATDCMLESF